MFGLDTASTIGLVAVYAGFAFLVAGMLTDDVPGGPLPQPKSRVLRGIMFFGGPITLAVAVAYGLGWALIQAGKECGNTVRQVFAKESPSK